MFEMRCAGYLAVEWQWFHTITDAMVVCGPDADCEQNELVGKNDLEGWRAWKVKTIFLLNCG